MPVQSSINKLLLLLRVFLVFPVLLTGYLAYNVVAGSRAVGLPLFDNLPLYLRSLFLAFFVFSFLAMLLLHVSMLFPSVFLTGRLFILVAISSGCAAISIITLVVLSFLPIHHTPSDNDPPFIRPFDQEDGICRLVYCPSEKPFGRMKALTKVVDRGVWDSEREQLNDLFNAERMRLGDSFSDSLREYLNTDVYRHFWASAFLSEERHLKGLPADLELALEVLINGLRLCGESNNVDERAHLVAMNVYAAIIAKKMGKNDIARKHKREVEELLEREPIFVGAWPSLTEQQKMYYESIEILGLEGSR